MKEVLKGFTETQAATDPRAEDPRLRGRTYAIPFEEVWQAALALCHGGMWGWSILSDDDERGVIEAISKALLFRLEDDVRVEIRLDENAQTRVDLWTASARGRANLGRSRRLVGKFLTRLDQRLEARPEVILDPTCAPVWYEPQ